MGKPASDDLAVDERGLLPAVVQDRLTGQVRMVAFASRESLEATLRTGKATFFSRSRGALWEKGESSGHALLVKAIYADCDRDVVLLQVDPVGPTCHTGSPSCFFRRIDEAGDLSDVPVDAGVFVEQLERTIASRQRSNSGHSYTKSLLDGGTQRIGAKLREEADELARALDGESPDRVRAEAADVVYHLLVGLTARGVSWRDVLEELDRRTARSGHAEKANRPRG